MRKISVPVAVSNRHIHLSVEHAKALLGEKAEMGIVKKLSQGDNFASDVIVTLIGENGKTLEARLVGPPRDYTQIEISATDARYLGVKPPINMSGDLEGAVEILVIYNKNKLVAPAIIAKRHIHLPSNLSEVIDVHDGDIISVEIEGPRGGVLNNVEVKEGEDFAWEMHVDTDEANALGLNNGDYVSIIE